MGPTHSLRGSHAPRLNNIYKRRALSLKPSKIDPFVYILLAHMDPYVNLYTAYEHQTYSSLKTLN